MRALDVAVMVFFLCWSTLPVTETAGGGSSGAPLSAAPGPDSVHIPQALFLNPFALPEQGLEKKETRFRRFEIIFFTSLPASVLLSLLGVIAFRGAAGYTGDFSAVEYRYLALSTIGISLGIAATDSRAIYKRGHR